MEVATDTTTLVWRLRPTLQHSFGGCDGHYDTAFSSCNVKAGSGVGVVVATGMKTRVGSIAALLNDSSAGDAAAPSAEDVEKGAAPAPKKQRESCLPDTKANQSPLQANLEKLAVNLGYMAGGATGSHRRASRTRRGFVNSSRENALSMYILTIWEPFDELINPLRVY